MKHQKYLMLQLFADDPAPADPAEPKPGLTDMKDPEPAQADPSDPKPNNQKYTDEDVDKILNQKFAEWQKKKQVEIDEAKRLAGMSATEKAEHERDVMKNQLEELMKQQTLTEMSKTARSILAEKDINVGDDLLSMLVSPDADKTKKIIDSFVTLFQGAVKKDVTEALKGNAPKAGGASSYTKEQIMAVKDRNERQKLIRENMSLFN